MPVETVLMHLAALSEAGYHEAVLTGIHMGCYGLDLRPPMTFTSLLKRISAERVIKRVRLSSIEPRELTDELIKTVADSDQFCRHFHIPLQSGDDTILKRMHRPYDVRWFRNRIQTIHQTLPEAAIGVDTLIGFPGETARAFENTRALIEELPIAYLHVFPFSPRKGTPAFDYADPVAPHVIKERCAIMRKLGRRKKAKFYEQQLGTSARVLIENRRERRSGLLKGVTSNYVTVLTDGPDQLKNSILTVRLEKTCSANAILGIQTT
jgi:threonylcarbamoyladenosine tRNA methylthiotransferase MtaB